MCSDSTLQMHYFACALMNDSHVLIRLEHCMTSYAAQKTNVIHTFSFPGFQDLIYKHLSFLGGVSGSCNASIYTG
jgi:hypothetical protein